MAKAKLFASTVNKMAGMSKARLWGIQRQSTQEVFNLSRVPIKKGGNMPVKFGNLRRSPIASNTEMPPINPDPKKKYDQDGGANVIAVIAETQLGQKLFIGYQANYAKYMEARYQFVGLAVQQWPQIVDDNVAKLLNRRPKS